MRTYSLPVSINRDECKRPNKDVALQMQNMVKWRVSVQYGLFYLRLERQYVSCFTLGFSFFFLITLFALLKVDCVQE